MPLIRAQLSIPIDEEKRTNLMRQLSAMVAQKLGKPESYMMVVVEPETSILMGASAEPAALVEVRSVGTITPEQTGTLSSGICEILEKATSIAPSRTYINYAGVPGAMWGFDRRTFG